jgi:DNA-binding MarR family transcriptional regulator
MGQGMTDYIAGAGAAALGARLRRLSAALDTDAARIYAASGIRFEQRWFGVINQLSLAGSLSVRELADILGITHASVSETRQSLEKAGLILSQADPCDGRRRVLTLSPSGEVLVRQLRPLWNRLDDAARDLDAESGGVTEALVRLERALARKPLSARVSRPDVAANYPTAPAPNAAAPRTG